MQKSVSLENAFFAYMEGKTRIMRDDAPALLQKAANYCHLRQSLLGITDVKAVREAQQKVSNGVLLRYRYGKADSKRIREITSLYYAFIKGYHPATTRVEASILSDVSVAKESESMPVATHLVAETDIVIDAADSDESAVETDREEKTDTRVDVSVASEEEETTQRVDTGSITDSMAAVSQIPEPPTPNEIKSWVVSPSSRSIAALLHIGDIEPYNEVLIENLPYCARARHSFAAHRILSIGDVLRFSVQDLFSFSNIGKGTIYDIIKVTSRFIMQNGSMAKTEEPVVEHSSPVLRRYDRDAALNILHGNNQKAIELISLEQLKALKKAREIMGDMMFDAVLKSPILADNMTAMFSSYVSQYEESKNVETTLQRLIGLLTAERKGQKVALFWRIFSGGKSVRNILSDIPSELTFSNFPSYIINTQNHDEQHFKVICDFLAWSAFDTMAQRDKLFDCVFMSGNGRMNDRNSEILHRRVRGETLTDIGNDLSLTRERVRQITLKQEKRLARFLER